MRETPLSSAGDPAKNGKAERSSAQKPRPVSSGDVPSAKSPKGIERYTVTEAIIASQEAKINAVKDIIGGTPPYDVETLARVLHRILDGASTDDADVLRDALLRQPYAPRFEGPEAEAGLDTPRLQIADMLPEPEGTTFQWMAVGNGLMVVPTYVQTLVKSINQQVVS